MGKEPSFSTHIQTVFFFLLSRTSMHVSFVAPPFFYEYSPHTNPSLITIYPFSFFHRLGIHRPSELIFFWTTPYMYTAVVFPFFLYFSLSLVSINYLLLGRLKT